MITARAEDFVRGTSCPELGHSCLSPKEQVSVSDRIDLESHGHLAGFYASAESLELTFLPFSYRLSSPRRMGG